MPGRIVLTITFLLGVYSAIAQIAFGAKAGLNLANWTTDGHNTLSAFQGGAVCQFPLGDYFSIQPELLYEGKGTDLSDFIPNNPMRFSLKYLTLEALFGYKTKGVTFMLGPYISNLLEYKLEINNEEVMFPDGSTPFEQWDWGIAAGATLEIIPGFGFEVLYYFGFPDIVDITFGDQNNQFLARLDKGMNRVLQLGVYYKVNSE